MIPRKLAEIFFAQLWILLIPVVLVPALVLIGTAKDPEYEARATVWVGSPIGPSVFGEGSPWMTRAQNSAQVVNDLLATDSFRVSVAVAAGHIAVGAPEASQIRAGRSMTVWAGTVGLNLVTITARSDSADDSAATAAAVIDEYLRRATSEAERTATLSAQYYEQQVAVANAELTVRQAALDAYVAERPQVLDPRASDSQDLDYKLLQQRVSEQQTLVDSLEASVQSTHRELASAPQSQELAFAVQDYAQVPDEPLPTSLSARFGLPIAALLFGLLLSGAYLVLRYRTDHTIRSTEDLSDIAVPLLGSIRELRPDGVFWWLRPAVILRRRQWRTFAQRTATSIVLVEGRPNAP
jgi:hypothetical protein